MSELRQRLEEALQPHTGSDGPGVGVPVGAVLSVFAEWLREQARERYYQADDYQSYLAPGGALDLVEKLIDDMAPKP